MCPFLLLGELVLNNIAAQTDQFNELIIHLSNTLLTASIKVLLLNILPTDRDLNEAHLSVNPTQQETLMSRDVHRRGLKLLGQLPVCPPRLKLPLRRTYIFFLNSITAAELHVNKLIAEYASRARGRGGGG